MNTFQLQPAAPDMNALRAAAAASVNYTPADIQAYMETDALMQAEIDERGGYAYAELNLEDKRELIAVGASVRYHFKGYGTFVGEVVDVNHKRERAEVKFCDQFGTRRYWCAYEYLTLILCKEAAATTQKETDIAST